MDANALLADLDADQRRAVTTDSHLVAVIAGAGSGKTRVLTRRVAWRIATESAEPAHTVVLTFTRQAAGELRRRLPRLGLTDRITAGTFHSVAQSLLRQRWIDRDQRPKTITTDRRRIVADIMGRDGLDELVAELDWATARGVTADQYEHAIRLAERKSPAAPGRVAEALHAYQQEKRRRGVIDLDDILALTIDAMERDPDFADATRWRYRHVLVDEAQDLNPLQHRLVDLLRDGRDDLYLVGDPVQAVYGFNGSDPGLLLDVSDRFPGIEIVRLPVNHRCTPQIVDAGAYALRSSEQSVEIRSARPDGPVVTTRAHADEDAEATWIAARIDQLDPALARSGRVAVLARTHAALVAVRSRLEEAGVPIRHTVDGPGSALTPFLREAYRVSNGNDMRRWAQNLAEQIEGSDDPRADIARAAIDFLREHPTGDGAGFRTWIGSNDPFGRDVPGVELITFHAAKGREWHTVFLVGCETSLVPHRSATTIAARAEEARLFYVALTRATDALTVNWAERRGGYQRKLTPLFEGFRSETPEPAPPPRALLGHPRSPRQVALDRLTSWREATARAGGILPDAVCSDRVLSTLADRQPHSPDELDQLTGLGPMTSRRLYDGIAAALADALSTSHSGSDPE